MPLKSIKRLSIVLTAALVSILPATKVAAHAFAPALLDVVQSSASGTQQFHVSWKTPLKQAPGSRLQPLLPSHCKVINEPNQQIENTARVLRWSIDCGTQGLVNHTLGASHIASSGTNVIVRVQLSDGRHYQQALDAGRERFLIPAQAKTLAVLGSYAWLGMTHLWFGPDHLLFVLSLVVLIGFHRKLIWAISGFTLGHSITLSLAALNIIRLPQTLAEILIALSLVMVAAEISKQARPAHQGLLSRYPGALTLCLGLVHGLGFAGALLDIGLPQEAIPEALLAFNAGIEIAQLLGITTLWVLLYWLQILTRNEHGDVWATVRWKLPISIPIGTLAAFWFWQRLAVL